jgi:hypothetical protein
MKCMTIDGSLLRHACRRIAAARTRSFLDMLRCALLTLVKPTQPIDHELCPAVG